MAHTHKLLNGGHSLLVRDDLREDGVLLKQLQGLSPHGLHTQGLGHTGRGGMEKRMGMGETVRKEAEIGMRRERKRKMDLRGKREVGSVGRCQALKGPRESPTE